MVDLSRKNPAPAPKEYNKELALLKKGEVTDEFAGEVIVRVRFGPGDEDLGLIPEPELPGSYVGPGAMAVGRNGDVWVADPVNRAIKIYSQRGEYRRKIAFDHDLLRDFGLDAHDNLYVLGPGRLYRKASHEDAFQAVGPALNNAFNLDVTPGGHASVLDYTPMPSDNLRVRKIDAQGNVLRTVGQHGFDQDMFEFEDGLGRPVTFFALGGGPAGAQYKITLHAARPHEVIYEGHLPPGYYYVSLEVMGFDARGQVYVLRMIAPDITDLAERTSKTEVWADILDLERGAISSVRLEPDRRLYGFFSTPNHIYDVDFAGNIYQMQADEDELRIVKYSRR